MSGLIDFYLMTLFQQHELNCRMDDNLAWLEVTMAYLSTITILSWRLGKITKNSVIVADRRVEIRTYNLPNMEQRANHSPATFGLSGFGFVSKTQRYCRNLKRFVIMLFLLLCQSPVRSLVPSVSDGLQILNSTSYEIPWVGNAPKTTFLPPDKNAPSINRITFRIISVGFWRWCVSIEQIVLLDFIHRLVSQEQTKWRN
jgi:hypothetical protein